MKKLCSLLRGSRGATLVEMMAALGLLAIAMGLCVAMLPPAARTVQRMEELNDAQVIASTLLENIQAELELAQGYIKCYDDPSPVGQPGLQAGSSIEFRTATNHVLLISAERCEATALKRPNGESLGTASEIPAGRLSYRYYTVEADGTYLFQSGGSPVARAMESVLGKGFYNVFQVSLHFDIAGDSRTVAVTVTVSREGQPVYQQTQVVDLRYAPPLDATITARAG